MSVNISYLAPKNSLAIASIKSALSASIVERVRAIDNYGELKTCNELLIFICSCVENTVDNKKIDKKTLVLDIYRRLYDLSTEEHLVISKSIDFLCDNALVKKIPAITKYSSILGNYIKGKF